MKETVPDAFALALPIVNAVGPAAEIETVSEALKPLPVKLTSWP